MAKVDTLLEGYQRFHTKHFEHEKKLYENLKDGQSPKTLVIGCSDSRVDPAILLDAQPGDIFVVRNVANLVPPYQPDDTYHGTSAALEFAVNHLEVDHIVVLGHSKCGGINALMNSTTETSSDEFSFISSWVNISKDAKERTLSKCSHSSEDKYTLCEKESIITSMANLMTFPYIKSKVKAKKIELHGWYFSLETGKLNVLQENGEFQEGR